MDIIKIACRHKPSHINNAKGERTTCLTCMFTGGERRPREGRSGGEDSVRRNTVLGMGFMSPGLRGSSSDQGVPPCICWLKESWLGFKELLIQPNVGVQGTTSAEYFDCLCSGPKGSPRCWLGWRRLIDISTDLDEPSSCLSPDTGCWCAPWHKT